LAGTANDYYLGTLPGWVLQVYIPGTPIEYWCSRMIPVRTIWHSSFERRSAPSLARPSAGAGGRGGAPEAAIQC